MPGWIGPIPVAVSRAKAALFCAAIATGLLAERGALKAQPPDQPAIQSDDNPGPDDAAGDAGAGDAGEKQPEFKADASPPGTKDDSAKEILDLDLDQLSKVQAKVPTSFDTPVTSVTKHESSVGKSPAAIFVVTQEMIRRSGVTSIPEALRMVPGLQVAKFGSSKWAITARGFNNQFANKLLVLIDGRSVYTPLFGGVWWDVQDLPLQDIDRIEVIRGPGATLWGANAVNGVINIITKPASETQGPLVTGGGGDQDRAITVGQQGGKFGENGYYRVYGKYFDRAQGFNPTGADDAWQMGRTGFRMDWDDPGVSDKFTLQGDLYFGIEGDKGPIPTTTFPFGSINTKQGHVGGGNVLGRWTRTIDEDNSFSVQAYYDRTERDLLDFNLDINIYDLEFQSNNRVAENHLLTWGGGYRAMVDNIRPNNPFFLVIPQGLFFDQASAFLQDEIQLVPDALSLMVGSKFMYYFFTGFEYQPSARLLWSIDDHNAAWCAVSRAVRLPTRFEEDALLTQYSANPFPTYFTLVGGGRSLVAEELLAYELGYRQQVNERLSWELATFYNVYQDVITLVPFSFTPGLPLRIDAQFRNAERAQSYGVELNWTYEISESWRLRGYYTFIRLQAQGDGAEDTEGSSPANQAYLMSSWNLERNIEFDLITRYVDSLAAGAVPAYTMIDARLAWKPNINWELSIVGQNLTDDHHLEFVGITTVPSEVRRGVYAQVAWRH